MRSRVTSVKNGFRVEDITFHGGRNQAEILNEIEETQIDRGEIIVPISHTPEQIKTFFESKKNEAISFNEKAVYDQTIKWIDECLELRKKVVALELKQKRKPDESGETIADIEKDVK